MCIICKKEYSEINSDQKSHTLELDCSGCPDIKEIPYLPRLEYLICSDCPNLRHIPKLHNLVHLWARNCPKLEKLPPMPKLAYLNCRGSGLKKIPKAPLQKLWCSDSKIREVPVIPTLRLLECSSCSECCGISESYSMDTSMHVCPVYCTRCMEQARIEEQELQGREHKEEK